MDVSVSSRNTEVPDNLKRVAEEKIGRLGRFLDGMDRAEVHFSEERNPRIADKEVCEVTLEGHGHYVRCRVTAPDGYVAVDRAVDKLEHQLHKLKTKINRRNGGTKGTNGTAVIEAEADEAPEVKIVKVKRFGLMPMTPEDAVDRMQLLGHGFFFFTNIDTHRAAVVYLRNDGQVGLIDEAD